MDNKESQSPGNDDVKEVADNETTTTSFEPENAQVSHENTHFAAATKAKSNPFWMIAAIALAIALIVVIIFPIGGNKKDTIATVNGTKITNNDLINTLQQYYGESISGILDRMITEEVIAQEAKAKNITVTDADIAADVAAMKIEYGSEENFNQFLSYYGMVEEDLKNELKLTTYIRLLLQDSVEVTDEEIQTYFDANKDNYGNPVEQVRASHILVEDKTLAEDILKQLKDGADFATLAAQYGMDGTAQQGGDLGFFPREGMIEVFSDAAFALEVNELSDIVESQYGYHVILKTDYKPIEIANLDDYKEPIRVKLVNEKIYTTNATYTEELRNKAKITNEFEEQATAL